MIRSEMRFISFVVCVVAAALASGKSISSQYSESSVGKPLFLTPYITQGEWIAGREAARVPSLIRGEDVESYAGYLTVNQAYGSNLFFWFFPAENARDRAPLVLWLQGGPGGSSLFGTFSENGPFSVEGDLTVKRRARYWSQELNVIYIDNPVGTGFSFTGEQAGYATNENDVGRDLYSAMVQFFQLFPELRKNEFYLTGESYAGKYIPALAYAIHANNPSANLKINLAGFAIGDGWIDPRNMMVYSDYLFQHGLIDDETMSAMKVLERNTTKLIDEKKFHEASVENDKILKLFGNISGPIDVYDYTKVPSSDNSEGSVNQFLNQSEVRKALHVGDLAFNDGSIVAKFLYDDVVQSVAPWLEILMDHYRVLLYNGQLDIIVAYPLTINFVKKLKWSGAEEYKNATRRLWYVDNELAGFVKTAGNFTEVLVRNAGHMVPGNQPKWAMDLITRFTQKIPFDHPFAA